MPDILNTSLTGMIAFQRALSVTSHNIANANTPGYSRQVANFTARLGSGAGNTYVGGGTQVASIQRQYDALQVNNLRNATTGFARFDTLNTLTSRVDALLADADAGLGAGLQSYFGALQDAANDPASIPARRVLLDQGASLAGRFRAIDAQLDELDNEVSVRMNLAVDTVNQLSASIADINKRIVLASGSGASPNDLLDQRDGFVAQLAEQVSITTNVQSDGSMSVFFSAGQPLVLGGSAAELGVGGSEFDPTRTAVVYVSASGATPIDATQTGGSLGGLIEFRDRVLDPARQSLGQTATAFVTSANRTHRSGMDLRGDLGAALFQSSAPEVLVSNGNSGTPTASVTVTDLGAFTGADYVLEYDGSGYSLTRSDTGTAIPLTGSGTSADPFMGDGLSIVTGGAPAAGDRLQIRSGTGIAGSVQSIVSDPQALALASPTRMSVPQSNTGSAVVESTVVIDPTDPDLLTTSVIEFTSPNTYSINGAGSFAWTSGTPIVINGSSVTLSGAPASGDQFTLKANFGAIGDNRNAVLLADLQNTAILDGGNTSINQNYGQLVASVGTTAYQINANRDAQQVVMSNVENAVLQTSAVNLDEEAANLIRYQQAYQAVAQVVAVASTLFDSLLNATRR